MGKITDVLKNNSAQNKSFALSRLDNYDAKSFTELHQEILKDPVKDWEIGFSVLPFSDEKRYGQTREDRKVFTENNIPYYHAAGGEPLLEMKNGVIYLAMPYRDGGAPTLKHHFTPASGLPDLYRGRQEKIARTMKREVEEELVFVDHDTNQIKLQPRYPTKKDLKSVYNMNIKSFDAANNEKLIEDVNVYSMGYAGPYDTVGTVMGLALYDLEFNIEDLQKNKFGIVNGEDTDWDREMGLFKLDSIYKGRLEGFVSKASISDDKITLKPFREKIENVKLTAAAEVVVEKIFRTGKDRFMKQLDGFTF